MARAPVPLPRVGEVDRFGFRHHRLFALGDGWQVLETSNSFGDPPDFAAAADAVAASTGAPVLAVFVSGGDCIQLQTALPGGASGCSHLPDVREACGVYKHDPVPVGRPPEDVVAELTGWAAAGGLTADPGLLTRVVTVPGPRDMHYLRWILFEAVGLPPVGDPVPQYLDPHAAPFSRLLHETTCMARAAFIDWFDDGGTLPAWVSTMLAVEWDVWAAVYDPAADPVALAARAVRAREEFLASGRLRPVAGERVGEVPDTPWARSLVRTLERIRRED
ncbi:hypothetical protein Val02_19180 [Virgisporangium aliadipatigenens]|uniref:Uncharacterized protein n=1 Tax=Virgisporangium aliadipatigenens TaxID=741659 RepID=A0A8J3YIH2_9ACTN|nr:hypothetical protein Val02_19180 [Virgisporangium aliadipatigenens]